jgi:hypothetical protein
MDDLRRIAAGRPRKVTPEPVPKLTPEQRTTLDELLLAAPPQDVSVNNDRLARRRRFR